MHALRFAIAARRFGKLAGAALALSFTSGAFAALRCDAPQTYVDLMACEQARQSPERLRRYVERTRALYHLYYWDYITPEQVDRHRATAQAAPATAVADSARR
jgi:hypothetical protein